MSSLADHIRDAVLKGLLSEPFTAESARRVLPGWQKHTYENVLAQHTVGNGKRSELFERVAPGWYRIIRSDDVCGQI